MQNDQIRHGNTYWEEHVLEGEPRRCIEHMCRVICQRQPSFLFTSRMPFCRWTNNVKTLPRSLYVLTAIFQVNLG